MGMSPKEIAADLYYLTNARFCLISCCLGSIGTCNFNKLGANKQKALKFHGI
jgi:hypothetical protein